MSISTAPAHAGASPAAPARLWWREAVTYQIYIRSFADADGDGIGDIAGIRSRLSYLAGLGVDALWINPWYPSPMADGGYDVADYRDIEPLFGTLADADALIREAHAAGLRLLVDLVPNHTSYRHVWFQEALASPPGSPARNRYLFRPGRGTDGSLPPNDWRSVFGGPAWTRVPDGQWYLHLFTPEQPDLDWLNPEVREEYHDILRFWLDRGADGFRIDVAHGLAKDPELPDVGDSGEDILEPTKRLDHPHWDLDEVHDVYRGWRRVLDEYGPDRVLVGEVWVANAERLARYLRPDELHTAFAFGFLKAGWDSGALRSVIDVSRAANGAVGAPTTWVLANHDVVRQVTRYAHGVGQEQGLARARAAALLMLALPGGVYLYQGEELGLPEVTDLPEDVLQDPVWERSGHTQRGRDGCRVPLPWTAGGPSYGFGPGGSWLPQPASWAGVSVEAQQGESSSTLELYRAGLRLRRSDLPWGEDLRWLDCPPGTLVFTRADDRGRAVVCAVNITGAPVEIPPYGRLLLASTELTDPTVLPADSAAWYVPASSAG
ncbi:MAG: glycoside hydrolase family 13 protein [Actinomycetota bacterium]|nr:glycoside hydrolase family 13 protein [Actinomycetota bacterium]